MQRFIRCVRCHESIVVGDVKLKLMNIQGSRVRVRITGPDDVMVEFLTPAKEQAEELADIQR